MNTGTDALKAAVAGRELQVLQYVGIPWQGDRQHIHCPHPDHADNDPSWRWDVDKSCAFCTCAMTGADIFDVVMAVKTVDFTAAKTIIADAIGHATSGKGNGKWASSCDEPKAQWTPIAVPKDAYEKPDIKALFGRKHSGTWTYRDTDEHILLIVLRFDKPDGGKEIRPIVFCECPDGQREWRKRSWPPPRPLFRLPEMGNTSGADVLLVEGEKTATVAAKLFPEMVVTTWPGGAQAIKQTNWCPLKGRDVVYWFDRDQAGRDSIPKIGDVLNGIAASFRVVPVPDTLPEKWDLADEIPQDLDVHQLIDAAGPYVVEKIEGAVGDGAQRLDERGAGPSATAHTIVPRSIADVDPAKIPPRRWIATGRFLRGAVTLTIAPPGAGKTMLALQEALAVTVGIDWAHLAIREAAATWAVNLEESLDELHRRLVAALEAMDIEHSAVANKFFLNGSEDRLVVARRDERGAIVATPDVAACIDHIREREIGLFVVDPFVEVHSLDENSNVEVKGVAAMFREIAQAAECAVHLVHHTRKPPTGSGEGHVGNADSARGGSALIGLARVAHTLFAMTKNDADRLGVDEDERRRHLRLDTAKSNYAPLGAGPIWFRREGVEITNGDQVGVLAFADLTEGERQSNTQRAERHRSIIARLLAIIPEQETLNRAGFALINQSETLFPNFRGREFASTCPNRVRREIEEAVQSGITVNGEGFMMIDNSRHGGRTNTRAKVLKRIGSDLFSEQNA